MTRRAKRSRSSASPAVQPGKQAPKIAILIVSYNAVNTLRSVLDRIPREVWNLVEEVMVFDDSSQDDTYLVGLGYKKATGQSKLSIYRNEVNLGYGGNQKRGYRYAIDKGYDIVALLHGDGQYAPEALPRLLEPLQRGEADAVFGSRMIEGREALRGGMPLYKFVGNKVLTAFENFALGMTLSEFHSGYRIYSCRALQEVPFERNTDDFHFDTQIIIQLHAAGKRIIEVPIPTYYGDEICYVNGMRYARDVARSVVDFKLHELGLRTAPEYEIREPYRLKRSPFASQSRIAAMVGPGSHKLLDVGCGEGELGHLLRQRGHYVVGLDLQPPRFELDEFIAADLADELPLAPDSRFDAIILADVLEHLARPEELLQRLRPHLAAEGSLLVSLPNAVHWSVRAQVAAGSFNYTNKGILDRGHLRFFTRQSAEQLFGGVGLRVAEHQSTPVPWENVLPRALGGHLLRNLEKGDFFLGRRLPGLFAYQHIFRLVPG